MRINPNPELPEGQPTDRVGAAGSSTQSAGTQSLRPAVGQDNADQAHLSSDALQLSNLSSTLASVPDVRSGRVAQVSQAVHSGNYAVSDQQIAQSMLRDFRMSGPPSQ